MMKKLSRLVFVLVAVTAGISGVVLCPGGSHRQVGVHTMLVRK